MAMRVIKRTIVPVSLLVASSVVTHTEAYGQSLSDCKAVAAKFRNTCTHGDYDTPATSMATMTSNTETCIQSRDCFVDATRSGEVCSWERKLCVTCRDDNGVTKIRIQSNNLPDHCIQNKLAKALNFDYEVIFNRQEEFGTGKWIRTLDTQQKLNDAVCPIHKDYSASLLGITEYGDVESRNAMAFAINGVAFQFANQIREDPVSPITVTNEQPLDICLGHNQRNSNSGMYHYHGVSPCINKDFLNDKTMKSCTDEAQCSEDVVSWALWGFDSMKSKTVIGLSKFGHVLYGPYDESGELWNIQDVDPCNGVWSGNEYFYVGTRWHPYAVGCQGPCNFPQNGNAALYPQCSTNGMDQYFVNNPVNEYTASPTGSPSNSPTVTDSSDTLSPTEPPTTTSQALAITEAETASPSESPTPASSGSPVKCISLNMNIMMIYSFVLIIILWLC